MESAAIRLRTRARNSAIAVNLVEVTIQVIHKFRRKSVEAMHDASKQLQPISIKIRTTAMKETLTAISCIEQSRQMQLDTFTQPPFGAKSKGSSRIGWRCGRGTSNFPSLCRRRRQSLTALRSRRRRGRNGGANIQESTLQTLRTNLGRRFAKTTLAI